VSDEVVYRPKKGETLGQTIDELARRYELRKQAERAMAALKKEEDAVREFLINSCALSDLNGARGKAASVAVVRTNVPVLKDWMAFFSFAKKKGNEDLLQREVSSPAWRERMSAGQQVPGVEKFERISLRLNPFKKE
jgi:hypothetical protein